MKGGRWWRAVQVLRAWLVLRLHGVVVGRRPRVEGRVPYVRNAGRIQVGDHLVVRGHQCRAALTTEREGTIVLGREVLLNQGATVHAAQSVVIGDRVKIADLAAIYDTDFHEIEAGTSVRVLPVVVGDDVWIGRGAVVLPGVTIGSGAVVAAGAVVTRDVPAATLVAGSPARVLRDLRVEPGFRRS